MAWGFSSTLLFLIKINNMDNTELIKFISNKGKRAVSGRDLHHFLGVGKDFSNWMKDRIAKYEFVENQDYEVFAKFGENPNGGRPLTEYALSIDMAKELAMLEGNEKGRIARKYFIECEKRLKELSTPSYQIEDPIERAKQWIKEQERLQLAIKEAQRLEEDNKHKAEVIEGLVSEISLADMRQRIVQIIRKAGGRQIPESYRLLYQEFNAKFHMNIFTRMNNIQYKGSALTYIDKELDMIPQLYDLTCKLFENTYEDLMKSWGKAAKRASINREKTIRYGAGNYE